MSVALWLLATLGVIGAFDTFYYLPALAERRVSGGGQGDTAR